MIDDNDEDDNDDNDDGDDADIINIVIKVGLTVFVLTLSLGANAGASMNPAVTKYLVFFLIIIIFDNKLSYLTKQIHIWQKIIIFSL